MTIKLFYIDLRIEPNEFAKFIVDWDSELSAYTATAIALGETRAKKIATHLLADNKELTVAWHSLISSEHSNVGGVDSLEWHIPDNSILSILYQDENITTEKLDIAIQWMLINETS